MSPRSLGEHSPSRYLFSILLLAAVAVFILAGGERSKPFSSPAQPSRPRAADRASLIEGYGKLPLSFEANQGQAGGDVKFLSRGNGYTLFLSGDEAVLSLRSQEPGVRSQKQGRQLSVVSRPFESDRNSKIETRHSLATRHLPLATEVLHMKLVGADRTAKVTATDELPGKVNYFIGSDPKNWRADVPTYAKVKYQNVYPGV